MLLSQCSLAAPVGQAQAPPPVLQQREEEPLHKPLRRSTRIQERDQKQQQPQQLRRSARIQAQRGLAKPQSSEKLKTGMSSTGKRKR
jgi:hypothetical protein